MFFLQSSLIIDASTCLKRLLNLIKLCDFWKIDRLKGKAVRAIVEFQLVNQTNWAFGTCGLQILVTVLEIEHLLYYIVRGQAVQWHADELVKYCEGASEMNHWA